MRINEIDIRNFRAFESKNVRFDPAFTLLVGPNGSGKSSLLAAIACGTRGLRFMRYFPNSGKQPPGDSFLEADYRHSTRVDSGGAAWTEMALPAKVAIKWVDHEEVAQQLVVEAAPYDYKVATSLDLKLLNGSLWSGDDRRPAPLILHAGLADAVPLVGQLLSHANPFGVRTDVYDSAWERSFDSRRLVQWFGHNELRTLQEGSAPPAYAAARAATLAAIHAEDIRFVVKDNQLMLLHAGEGWRPFDQLSDGQKRIANIFCELALRCATLNSHLAERCVVDTPGVVTIDELDLHLHPKWQRSLIGDLCRTFPKLQFIASSHSPFLLQAAFEHGKVLDVGKGQFVEPGDPSIEDIAEAVMGVPQPQRSQRFNDLKHKAQRFYELLESQPVDPAERQRLQAELDAAMAPFANDPAAAAWLEQRREAAGH